MICAFPGLSFSGNEKSGDFGRCLDFVRLLKLNDCILRVTLADVVLTLLEMVGVDGIQMLLYVVVFTGERVQRFYRFVGLIRTPCRQLVGGVNQASVQVFPFLGDGLDGSRIHLLGKV
jgi:hypothetical protein